MGNSLSQEEIEIRTQYLDKIKYLNVPILDIGNKNGVTDYLDFIKPEELKSNNIVKGRDISSRPFIVFKAEFEYPNGIKKKTFTTFFQRYSDNDLLWHSCGHYGINLMCTDGGASGEQIKMLYELLSSGEYKINREIIHEQRLNFKINDDIIFYENLTDDDYPTIIRIGETI
jgi:hypothetical protein